MAKNNEGSHPAMWDMTVTMIFCDLCVKEIEIGNRPTTYFNKEGWLNIGARFKELTGREYDKLKFKNKWDQLKREWKLWKELKRGATGLGWDPIKRTIAAPEEWWAEKLKALPLAKKFRISGIDPEFEAKMDIMFNGVVATGRNSGNPTEPGYTAEPDEFIPEVATGSGEGPPINIREESSFHTNRPRAPKRQKQKDIFVKSSIDRLIDVFAAQPVGPSSNKYEDVIEALDALPEVASDLQFYMKCFKKLKDSNSRDMFMALRPEMRVQFLHALLED